MYQDGSGAMVDGTPAIRSTPPIGAEPRYVVGAALDLGAFEYGNAAPGGKRGGCGCASGNDEPGGWLLAGLVIASLCRRRRDC